MVLYGLLWSCMAFYGLYGLLWPYMANYRFDRTCIVFSRGHRSKFIWSCFILKENCLSRKVKEAILHLMKIV